ncbi:MAG: ATP-grasp domain-containing protein [Candidatus Thorarchaeota archaeon]
MTNSSSILDGKKVGVIGFNARPIAASLKRKGARTYVSDYWGDSDLPDVSDDCIAVLTPVPGIRQRQPLDVPIHQSLIDNFIFLTKKVELDYIMLGSGFDDHADALESLHEDGKLIGSSPIAMKNSRNLSLVSSMIDAKAGKIPQRKQIQSVNELLEKSSEMEFPYLVRPLHSGGGSGIRFISNHNELKRYSEGKQEEGEERPLVIQQYIRGNDYSCSVLSTGKKAKAVSVQSQLIGTPSAGRNCDFAYCGNYLPSGLDSKIEQNIIEISEYLSVKLNLQGSIGFDFVGDESNTIWLMEINPRLQGTLEMLEIAGNISVTEQHIRAVKQELVEEIPSFSPTVKMIVYSRKSGSIPDLTSIPDTFDKSPAGVFVNRGDPICTVVKSGKNIKDCYNSIYDTTISIQSGVKPV